MADLPLIHPQWPAPNNVKALVSTRLGGASKGPFESLNLGTHVGDDLQTVNLNRQNLEQHLPQAPMWLNQVHGIDVIRGSDYSRVCDGDASMSQSVNQVCAVMTADCLPVLFCDEHGTQVAAAHAGWRGLVDGVLEATVATFEQPSQVIAWLGPAIGPDAFEVGDDVRDVFCAQHDQAAAHFKPSVNPNKWLADLYGLARMRLSLVGVSQVYGGDFCTYHDAKRFFSYRRDGQTGRMAACIWLTES